MDSRLKVAVQGGDIAMLNKLIEEDKSIIEQKDEVMNTVLHLAVKRGHVELVSEILRLFPELVNYKNKELETPLHEACRQGQLQIIRLFLDSESNTPTVVDSVYNVNCCGETTLFVACKSGSDEVVKYLLEYFPKLLKLEKDVTLESSLHIASSSGYSDIVKEILKARPSFAWKKNFQGNVPLHLACIHGHLEIVTEFLRLDDDLSVFKGDKGRTPLHWAVIKGHIDVISEILSINPESAEIITEKEETVFHLAVKYKRDKVVGYLIGVIDNAINEQLINLPNKNGDTVLHLASRNISSYRQAKQHIYTTKFLLKSGVHVNILNHNGDTVLDVAVASLESMSFGTPKIVSALKEAGGKLSGELTQIPADIQRVPTKTLSSNSKKGNRSHDHHRSTNRKELQNEGLRNAINTITIVAVLIATVTFTAGINPPGGFNQETGKATRAHSTEFKVFLICDIMALILSLGIVNVQVSIIPLRRKPMMKLLVGIHKVMWVSTLFMTSAYIAGIWTIMPRGRGTRWVKETLVVIGGGGTMIVFIVLLLLLARLWYRKHQIRKQRKQKVENKRNNHKEGTSENKRNSHNHKEEGTSDSDIFSDGSGYYSY